MESQMNIVSESEAAKFLGVSIQTLRNRRSQKKAPVYLKMGRNVRYLMCDLEQFIADSRTFPDPETDADKFAETVKTVDTESGSDSAKG